MPLQLNSSAAATIRGNAACIEGAFVQIKGRTVRSFEVTSGPQPSHCCCSLNRDRRAVLRRCRQNATLHGRRRVSRRQARSAAAASQSAAAESNSLQHPSWEQRTQQLVALSTLPFFLLMMPQVVKNASNFMAGNARALAALSWVVRPACPRLPICLGLLQWTWNVPYPLGRLSNQQDSSGPYAIKAWSSAQDRHDCVTGNCPQRLALHDCEDTLSHCSATMAAILPQHT